MRIGILTLHRANNYGAALQCFALQETLVALGYEVYVIDYRQPDTEDSYKVLSWKRLRNAAQNLRSIVKELFIRIPYSVVQQKGFNTFRRQYLHCTPPVFDAQKIPQNFDAYIIGSDQLWSIQCMNGHIEPVYFGQFPHSNKSKIIGYAISSNIASLKEIGTDRLNQYLSSFNTISLREAGICKWITENTHFPVRQDVDPTLLYDIGKWKTLLNNKRPTKDRYILMYFLLPEQKSYAYKFAKQHGLRLIEVGKVAYSPKEFLTYIKYSDYILGGSFHIAVFSIIFEKKFSIIKKNNDFDIRSSDLLDHLGLTSQFIDIKDLQHVDINQEIEFSASKKALFRLREQSIEFLRSL